MILFLRWNDAEFMRNMRMSRSTFGSICHRLYDSLHREDEKALSVQHQCALAIYRLVNGRQVRQTAKLFGVSDSSVIRSTQRFISALLIFLEDNICFPSNPHDMAVVAAEFPDKI